MKKSIIIIIAVVAVIVIWAVSMYNGLVTMDENVNSQWANVETQYQRRADLIPNLVNTVKGYASHEKETLEGVVEARSKATQMQVNASDLTPEKLAAYQKAQGAVTSALGIIQALFRILPVMQDMVGNAVTIFSVTLLRLCDCLLIPRPVQFQYRCIFHRLSPF